jgi:hypothetical protein
MARNKKAIVDRIKQDPTESLRLLDDEDLNLGAVHLISPNPQPGLGIPERLLDVQCAGRKGEFVTVCFNILPTNNDANDRANYSGPIVGIVEFGNGSALNRVEIDIPNGNNITEAPNNGGAFPSPASWIAIAGTVPAGGTAISVPGSSVRVYARHDGNGRVWDPTQPISINTDPATGLPFSIQVQASISYGIRSSADNKLYRTLMVSNFSGAVPTNQEVNVAVPPFAKSVTLYRPGLEALTVRLMSRQLFGIQPGINIEVYNIPVNVNSPVIPLSGLVDVIAVTNLGAPDGIFAVFGIGL